MPLTAFGSNTLAIDTVTHMRPEPHACSIRNIFGRFGEIAVTENIIHELPRRNL